MREIIYLGIFQGSLEINMFINIFMFSSTSFKYSVHVELEFLCSLG